MQTRGLLWPSLRRLSADERGIAMVSVVGMSAILFSIAAVIFTRNLSDYNQVRSDRRFEQAIQVADSGVDHTLFKVGANPSYTTEPAELGGDPDVPDFAGDKAAEEAWVLFHAADNPLVITPEGEWATIRPSNAEVIYSVGYVPTRANPFKTRIIRAAYDYAPFVPSTAILTDGDLQLGGNAQITGDAGGVHTNGNLTITGATVTVEKDQSAKGECFGCTNPPGGGQPEREVPLVDPRENYALSEYDLCPDGQIRTGPSYAVPDGNPPNASGTPCQGTILPGLYRGWTYQGSDNVKGANWKYNDQTPYHGVYYIYQGSALIEGSPGTPATPWLVTIFAESTSSSGGERGHCDIAPQHVGGDIDAAGGGDVRPNPKAHPLHLIAGRDLQMRGTPGNRWEGVYAAHEQFELTGNVVLNGVIIANDYCDTRTPLPGSPVQKNIINVGGSASLNYNGDLEVPLGRRIRTTHWNEI